MATSGVPTNNDLQKKTLRVAMSAQQLYRITLRRSPLKLPSNKLANVKALGLRKTTGSVSFAPVTPAIAGKILSVKELLKVELVDAEQQRQELERKQTRKDTDKGWSKVSSSGQASSTA